TGKIIATHSKRRRRVEFLDFMNSVTAAFPDRQLHVILDNLNTHKKNEHWLKAHPNVQFHFTPTSASWLNQVEVWFSILQGQSLSGASFTCLNQLEQHIDAYINAYNDKAEPFVWTKKKSPSTPLQNPPYHSAMKLEKLAMDPRCSPQRIGAAHLADKLAYFYRHGRSSAAVLRFPSPIRSKSRTVPTDYGLRSDDCKCAIHLGKQLADATQYQPVNRHKS